MIGESGFLHLPYDMLADAQQQVRVKDEVSTVGFSWPYDRSYTGGLAGYSPVEVNGQPLKLGGSEQLPTRTGPDGVGVSVGRQVALQYGNETEGTNSLSGLSADIYAKSALKTVHDLKEEHHLYLHFSQQYDLSSWVTYDGKSLTYKDAYELALPELLRGNLTSDQLQTLITQIQQRHIMFQRVYLCLPKEKSKTHYSGYAQAFFMLTNSVLSTLRRKLVSMGSEET